MWEQAAAKGDYLIPKLKALADRYPQIYRGITGKGLLIGQHFHTPEIGYRVAAVGGGAPDGTDEVLATFVAGGVTGS